MTFQGQASNNVICGILVYDKTRSEYNIYTPILTRNIQLTSFVIKFKPMIHLQNVRVLARLAWNAFAPRPGRISYRSGR